MPFTFFFSFLVWSSFHPHTTPGCLHTFQRVKLACLFLIHQACQRLRSHKSPHTNQNLQNAASSTWSLDKTAGTWRLIEEWIGESPTPPANPARPRLPVLCLAGISPQTGRRSWVNKPSNPPRSCQIYCRNLWSAQSEWLTGPKWLVMTRTAGKWIKGALKCFIKWKYISRTIMELSGILSNTFNIHPAMQLDCWFFKLEILYIRLANLQERVFSVFSKKPSASF